MNKRTPHLTSQIKCYKIYLNFLDFVFYDLGKT